MRPIAFNQIKHLANEVLYLIVPRHELKFQKDPTTLKFSIFQIIIQIQRMCRNYVKGIYRQNILVLALCKVKLL